MGRPPIYKKEILDQMSLLIRGVVDELGLSAAIMFTPSGDILIEDSRSSFHYDTNILATLAAGNLASMKALADLVGCKGEAQLYLRGQNESLHFDNINNDLYLIAIIENTVSIGFFRSRMAAFMEELRAVPLTSD